ncbi:hypothetical protein Cob_v005393 [Colletotrichum orbiculare MAFF 240422]|uniref:Uncharacterized protein n=1 Tax=Colletotrichum orbiculare (strain 104-T / ATCC 96160 / CBS 514.97 / LARS 414 / MAFF 240422) TaxID=1213857 RepID=N4VPM8_COLOR|nr:hypothetical protein Cob_v005393 [Colletotrichum orbiculare MAFF 240422]
MAPLTPHSNPIPLSGLTPRVLQPSRTESLPSHIRDIFARQVVTVTSTPESTDESASDNNLSGGAIAGIVIGSIAGFLLLLWIIKSCGAWGQPNDWGDKDSYDDRRHHHDHRGRSPGSRHRRRNHHGHYHHETSRSRRPSYEVNEVRYAQPVVYEKRRPSASPRAPAAVYKSSRSRSRY